MHHVDGTISQLSSGQIVAICQRCGKLLTAVQYWKVYGGNFCKECAKREGERWP